MIDTKLALKISQNMMSNITKKELDLEIGRFIEEDPLLENTLKIWIVKLNERQINERSVEFEDYPEISIQLTIAPPKFFSDVVRGEAEVPFWQIATVVRSLSLANPFYDPEMFIEQHIDAVKNLNWPKELIEEKKQVTELLLSKAEKYGIDEDMLADGYMWAIKAAEEAICVPLMEKNLFGLATPTLLLDTLRLDQELFNFYIQILGVDILTPDLALIALKELERLADHLFHANEKTKRSSWILGSFVSINQVERKLSNVFESVGHIDSMELQLRFEDALAELWHAFWMLAQNPDNSITPLDPWVVGLTWKWLISQGDIEGLRIIIERTKNILKYGNPKLEDF
jgi:hypothetical protein